MVDVIERFFNWQTDMDWAWGPFLPLRPPREVPMQPWVWGRLFAAFTLLGLLLIGIGTLAVVLLPKFAAVQRWVVPTAVSETLATLSAMAADRGFQWALAGLTLSLPGLFFLACLPFHLAWNRRASRLVQMPTSSALPVEGDIWPPAPNRET